MKQLIMMRHGKSSWDHGVPDRERPLKKRGEADAHRVASAFREDGPELDFVYSSPANRALSTCTLFMGVLGHPKDRFQLEGTLYDFSGHGVKDFVQGLDDRLGTVAIFGHNNALTSLANAWGDLYIDNLPTAGLVHIVFKGDRWATISRGRTQRLYLPKLLKD